MCYDQLKGFQNNSDLSTNKNVLGILLQNLFQSILTRPSYDTLHFSITPLAPFFGCMYQTRYPVGIGR